VNHRYGTAEIPAFGIETVFESIGNGRALHVPEEAENGQFLQ